MTKKVTSSNKRLQMNTLQAAPPPQAASPSKYLTEPRRAHFVTVHEGNMAKAGLTKEEWRIPEVVAKVMHDTWVNSGSGREAGVVVCRSKDGLYHAHCALYSQQPTTIANVAKIMFDSHVEPQKANKKQLTDYLRKNPPYDEKGEVVLYELNLDCIKDVQGKKSIFDEIDALLAQGATPSQIMERGIQYCRYEQHIKSLYFKRRVREVGPIKDLYVEYHFGASGTGKTYTYVDLCKQYSMDNVYMLSDYKNGGLDRYQDEAPDILFMDELKCNSLSYAELLSLLDRYPAKQAHSRYSNTYPLWTKVYMTSVYSIEELYRGMVGYSWRTTDGLEQLLRRINTIVYHYKEDGEYKTFSMPASEYKDKNDMLARLHKSTDGFQKVSPSDMQQIPFETEEGH